MCQAWLREYECNRALYQEVTEMTKRHLCALLREKDIHVHMVAGRIKARQSLEEKIRRNAGRYGSLADITDLCGIRVITYYADEIDAVAACIRGAFAVDEENCVDKRKLLQADSFGYLSLHLILEIPYAHAHGGFCCKVEVQIRSVLQHAWAAVEHALAYKQEAAENYAQRRAFSRLAGMLELADLEFLKIRDAAALRQTALASLPEKQRRGASVLTRLWRQRRHICYKGAACFLAAAGMISIGLSIYCGSQVIALLDELSSLLKNA